jgi:hypothetical protein
VCVEVFYCLVYCVLEERERGEILVCRAMPQGNEAGRDLECRGEVGDGSGIWSCEMRRLGWTKCVIQGEGGEEASA